MMNKKIIPFCFILIITLIATSGIVSCKKTKPCDVVVTVTDTLGHPVSGATVILRQDSVQNTNGVIANIYDSKVTDFNGQSFHEFKWEAVLILEASRGNLKVRDYVRLEQSKTVNKEVTLRK